MDSNDEQAMIVFLASVDLSDADQQDALSRLEIDLIESVNQSGAGEFDGNEIGPDGIVLYLYGPDAELLFSTISGTLAKNPLSNGARVVLRYGGPGSREREVNVGQEGVCN